MVDAHELEQEQDDRYDQLRVQPHVVEVEERDQHPIREDVELGTDARLLVEPAREEAVDDVEEPVHAEPDEVPGLVALDRGVREHDKSNDETDRGCEVRPRRPRLAYWLGFLHAGYTASSQRRRAA